MLINFRQIRPNTLGNLNTRNLLINLLAICLVISFLIFFGWGAEQATKPIDILQEEPIRLDFISLSLYTLRTLFRMLIAMLFSIIFSISYAVIASKFTKIEQALLSILDVLQSVPILGYISFTVTGFVALAPNSVLGFEMAAIFAIFTSQAWNITFSAYQSFKTTPEELIEVANSYGFGKWRKFWTIELPYAVPGIIWNSIVSMSGAWFFVVASENIVYHSQAIQLPGIGSYIAVALQKQDLTAIISALIAMVLIIIVFNKIFFQLLLDWANKFRYESIETARSSANNLSQYLGQSLVLNFCSRLLKKIYQFIVSLELPKNIYQKPIRLFSNQHFLLALGLLYDASLALLLAYLIKYLYHFFYTVSLGEIAYVCLLTCITFIKIITLLMLASLILVPIGIYVGFRPALSKKLQPIIQIFASFPANLAFPLMVIFINKHQLNPDIWLSPLMVIAAQWYILFNVIAGASQIPGEYLDITNSFKIATLTKYRKVILPAIMPYYITGLITALGAGWNASIVAEAVTWGNSTIYAHGIGSYITRMTLADDNVRTALGVVVMCLFVVILNKTCWSKIQNLANEKFSNKI